MATHREIKVWIDCRLYSNGKTGIGRLTNELVEFYNWYLGTSSVGLLVASQLKSNNTQLQTSLKPYRLLDFVKFPSFLKENGIGLLHSPFYSALAFKSDRITSIVTVPDVMYRLTPEFFSRYSIVNYGARKYFDLIVSRSITNADTLISISNTTRLSLHNWLGKDSLVIYPADYSFAKSTDACSALELATHGLTNNQYILYAGNARPHKNVDFLVQAHKKSATNKVLVLVGSDFSEFNSDRIKSLGFVSDSLLSTLYKECHAVIFPSLSEGFGYPMLEASNIGKPIIASDIPTFRELNIAGVVYFNPRDVDSLVRVLNNQQAFSSTSFDSHRFNKANFRQKHIDMFQRTNTSAHS